jgi:succinyl-CoA synthetase alpha subunit
LIREAAARTWHLSAKSGLLKFIRMSIIIDNTKRVLIQGITGREGRARAKLMRDFGTNVVAGVTPGKGGELVEGIPVFNTVREATKVVGGIDISVVFIPAAQVKSAAIDAIDAGVKFLVLVPDRVPVWDVMQIWDAAQRAGARFVGPNTLGVLSTTPGRGGILGMIGGRAESARQWFKPGHVGIISRSGGMTSSCGYYLGTQGIGLSTIVHVGGDSVLGLRFPDVALMFESDPDTKAIVTFGEIGGSQEEDLAELVRQKQVTKPVIAYIGGAAAKEGTRFSHAGAIIEGNRGTHAGKVKALREAGATVVTSFGELPKAALEVLRKHNIPLMDTTATALPGINPNAWTTAITQIKPNEMRVRGYDIADLMGKVSFGQAVYLILRGELPSPAIGKLMDAMLVASIDHGATPPSALAARTVASTGASLSASVAAGIMSINQHHGGAIEDASRILQRVIGLVTPLAPGSAEGSSGGSRTMDEAAQTVLDEEKAADRRVPGFGHRYHSNDPRTARLFALAKEAGVDGSYLDAARAIERRFAVAGKKLPINVDGALGAILSQLGFPPEIMNGLFMIARTPGLVAHVHEERTRMPPMRRIDPVAHTYDGPPPRRT